MELATTAKADASARKRCTGATNRGSQWSESAPACVRRTYLVARALVLRRRLGWLETFKNRKGINREFTYL